MTTPTTAPSPPWTPSPGSPSRSDAAPTPAARYHQPYRPEAEPHFALPHHEFGLDVIALVGRLRYAEHRSVPEVHQELTRRCVTIAQRKQEALRKQLQHFVKVTTSYWPGLFPCYRSEDLPRTNNDLEHLFGSHRDHERRASGRKRAAPGLVVAGSVRVVASLATRLRPEEGLQLPSGYVERWQESRAALE